MPHIFQVALCKPLANKNWQIKRGAINTWFLGSQLDRMVKQAGLVRVGQNNRLEYVAIDGLCCFIAGCKGGLGSLPMTGNILLWAAS